jgi:OmcA/MtrC family decaheme c-type cytochrome
MIRFYFRPRLLKLSLLFVLFVLLSCLALPIWANLKGKLKRKPLYTSHNLAYYLTQDQIGFVRPGLKFTIQSATIRGSDLKIQVTFSITDDLGLPLDRQGIYTPGPVSTSFVAAAIPKGQSQYVAYTTRDQTSPITGVKATQAGTDSGGTYAQIGDGLYTYTFGRALPSNYDRTVTHTVALYGQRDLTEFDLGTQVSNAVYSWVPDGSPVTVVRDVVRTETCNKCHDPLQAHGGQRREVALCVTCHTPQTVDPDTGNTVDLKVMAHKIHAGEHLPSVEAGTPYQIIGFQQGVNDYSHVTFPQDIRGCETCHDGSGTQSTNWLTAPTRAACGSCHDDVNFVTGENHPGGAQASDAACARCHVPEGDLEFDASIKGAHTIPRFSRELSGVQFEILGIKNTAPGQNPEVSLKITDKDGFPIETSQMNFLNLVIAGPNTDFATYWSESVLTTPSTGGVVTYTFKKGIPSDAKGSYTLGVEGYRNATIQTAPPDQSMVRDVGYNKTLAFAVTDQSAVPRRIVATTASCNSCHGALALHGTIRQEVQYCVMCHNPNNTDTARRPADQAPPESIHFKTLVHKIHRSEALDQDFTVYGFNNIAHNYNEVTFPGDLRNCEKCHQEGTQQINLPKGLLPSVAPRSYINPMQPATAACLSCHDTQAAASHAFLNTSPIGESCLVCHGPDSVYSVDKVHAR